MSDDELELKNDDETVMKQPSPPHPIGQNWGADYRQPPNKLGYQDAGDAQPTLRGKCW